MEHLLRNLFPTTTTSRHLHTIQCSNVPKMSSVCSVVDVWFYEVGTRAELGVGRRTYSPLLPQVVSGTVPDTSRGKIHSIRGVISNDSCRTQNTIVSRECMLRCGLSSLSLPLPLHFCFPFVFSATARTWHPRHVGLNILFLSLIFGWRVCVLVAWVFLGCH